MNETPLYWVGIDVAKPTFDAAVASPGQRAGGATLKKAPVQTFARDAEGVQAFVQWLHTYVADQTPYPVRAVMEATGVYSIQLTALLSRACPALRPAIVNPERTAAFRDSLGLRNKTDRLDARALAFYGLERQPDPYEPLSPAQAELRALSRCRDDLIATRTVHSNQLGEQPTSVLVRKTLKTLLARIDKDIAKLEHEMKHVIQSNPELKRDYELLLTIPSVGFVTAAVVLAEFGDLRRFGTARQIGAHAGVTAAKVESGAQANPGHMSKKGSARVRQALYMASITAINHNPPLMDVYTRLCANGKLHMVALGAVMRKLLVLMRAVVVSGKPFNRSGKPCEEAPQNV